MLWIAWFFHLQTWICMELLHQPNQRPLTGDAGSMIRTRVGWALHIACNKWLPVSRKVLQCCLWFRCNGKNQKSWWLLLLPNALKFLFLKYRKKRMHHLSNCACSQLLDQIDENRETLSLTFKWLTTWEGKKRCWLQDLRNYSFLNPGLTVSYDRMTARPKILDDAYCQCYKFTTCDYVPNQGWKCSTGWGRSLETGKMYIRKFCEELSRIS